MIFIRSSPFFMHLIYVLTFGDVLDLAKKINRIHTKMQCLQLHVSLLTQKGKGEMHKSSLWKCWNYYKIWPRIIYMPGMPLQTVYRTLFTRANLNLLSINPILLVYMYIKLIWLIHTTCVCSLQSTIPLGTQLALLKLDRMFYRWNERCLLTGLMIEFVPYSRFLAYKKKKIALYLA